MAFRFVAVYIVLKLLIMNSWMQCSLFTFIFIIKTIMRMQLININGSHSPTGPYAWLLLSSISSLGDTSS